MANAAILGTGRAYPKGVLTNADLEQMVETSDEWITTRTGIKERHRAAADEYTSMFAVEASRKAIENARLFESEHEYATTLATLAEIGRDMSAILDLNELLTRVAHLVKRQVERPCRGQKAASGLPPLLLGLIAEHRRELREA